MCSCHAETGLLRLRLAMTNPFVVSPHSCIPAVIASRRRSNPAARDRYFPERMRSRISAHQMNIAETIDARVEEAAHHGRGLVLGDDGGAGDAGAGLEVGAPMDRYLDRLAGRGVVDAAPALRLRRVRAFGFCRVSEGR